MLATTHDAVSKTSPGDLGYDRISGEQSAMNTVAELQEFLSSDNGDLVNWQEIREKIHQAHRDPATTFDERGLLLGVYWSMMDLVERSGMVDAEKFRVTRNQDYNLLLISESTEGQNVDPRKLLAVCERELAAGRIAADHELRKLAQVGDYLDIGGAPATAAPPRKSWASWLFGRR